jgi:uncharacterized peroxidase-related enzyme
MVWIEEIPEAEAQGKLREIYERIVASRGKVANILRVQSLHPEALDAHLSLYLAIMFSPSGLPREERELIAVVVSAANGCGYCISHHAEALRHYWGDEERVRDAARDWRSLGLPERTCRILAYAEKLTRFPHEVCEGDVRSLREVGLTDREILEVALVASYFNFVNRIALGLGVAPSPEEVRGYRH